MKIPFEMVKTDIIEKLLKEIGFGKKELNDFWKNYDFEKQSQVAVEELDFKKLEMVLSNYKEGTTKENIDDAKKTGQSIVLDSIKTPYLKAIVDGKEEILEEIGKYVMLKKEKNSYKGLCPFHDEKTPSFVVLPKKQIWHCFSCGEGGTVDRFKQKYSQSVTT